MNRLLNRLFGPPEEINGGQMCPTYLYRWHVFATRWFKVYLHHFVNDDWARDLHDHPKRFLTIGLKGWYLEHTPSGIRRYRAPWVRTFSANHIHRITVPSKCCWTLVIVFRRVRKWGFWHNGQFIPWDEYVGSELAHRMKSCD